MATHISLVGLTSPGSQQITQAFRQLIVVRQQFQRLLLLANTVCSNGGQPALLETGHADSTFALPEGTGSPVYTLISDTTAALNALTSLSDLDQGT